VPLETDGQVEATESGTSSSYGRSIKSRGEHLAENSLMTLVLVESRSATMSAGHPGRIVDPALRVWNVFQADRR
jgi:hypothetical protein